MCVCQRVLAMRESAEFKISFASSSSSPTKRERERKNEESSASRFDKNRKSQPGRTTHHRAREKKVKTNFALKAAHLGNHRHPLTGKLPSESELFQRIRQRLISIHLVRACSYLKKKSCCALSSFWMDPRDARAILHVKTRGMREL